MTFEFNEYILHSAIIKIVGVGGAGCKAVDNMIDFGLEKVEFLVVDIDGQALDMSQAKNQVQLGKKPELIKSSGIEDNLEIGRTAALEVDYQISEQLSGANLVFVVVGMGGETGTGAAPIVAQLARELGALVVGLASMPFDFEGKKRVRKAEDGFDQFLEQVDSLITISSQNLLNRTPASMTEDRAFRMVDDALFHAVHSIVGLLNHLHTPIATDFQDIEEMMGNAGKAVMGTEIASGVNRVVEATLQVIASLQKENWDVQYARSILISLTTASYDRRATSPEMSYAVELVIAEVHEDCEMVLGTTYDESLKDNIRVTVIATGLEPGK